MAWRRSEAKQGVVALLAAAVTFAVLSLTSLAWAEDPKRVEWSQDWPRVRLVEVVDVVALTVASFEIDAQWAPPAKPRWSGGILFDDWVRRGLRGRSYAAQSTAIDVADALYKGGVLAPYIVDVYIVALGIHQSVDVAVQMLLINMQSLGLAGVTTLASEHLGARGRPYSLDCGPDGQVRDATGKLLANRCDGYADNQSFYSGHAAATATMAGLTCVHHQHLPLYGGGFADLAPCLVMIGASAVTGVGRVVADRHWASDVLLGWGVGALSGYVLPSILHYGFTRGHPVGEVKFESVQMVPVPQAYPGGAGLGVAGFF